MRVKLKELGEVITGNTPSKMILDYWDSDDVSFVKPDIISDSGITTIVESSEYLSEKAREKARIVSENAIFVTCIGSIGKIGIAGPGYYAFNQQINVIVPNENVVPKYLAYAMLHSKPQLTAIANAPVVPIINKSQFSDFEINIDTDMQKQAEIVNFLDKVVGIIQARENELLKLDDLVKARFVELFGGYERTTTIARYISELRGGKSIAGTEPCKNKVLKTGATTFGWFDPEQYKYLPTDYEPLPEHKVETGDVIISRMNTPELVGACSYVFNAPDNMYYPDRLWKAVLQENTNPIFLWQLLWDSDVRKAIKEKSGGTSGTMHNISKPNLLAIKCMDAPIELQNQFAAFVHQVDKSKDAVQKSLDKLQILFDKLMQEYFG